MKKVAILAAGALFVAACGGKVNQELIDAAPGYDALAMDMTSADTTPPANALGPGSTPGDGANPRVLDDPCHPHLFWRTHEVVARVNRHLYKFLGHVERVVHTKAKKSSASSATWFGSKNGVDAQLTITKTAPQQFSWKLELRKTGDTAWTTVFSGNIDRTGATAPHQGTGAMALDLTALHDITGEKLSGTATATFASTSTSRKIVVDAQNVTWEVSDANLNLTPDEITALETPRNAHYVYYREPGKGGSVKVSDDMVFLCPSNPSLKLANADVVARWYRLPDGTVHGRADALMTGGQLPDHQLDDVEGLTCYDAAPGSSTPTERYWLMKAEDAAGVVASETHESGTDGPATCDAVFGAVPSATDKSNDFDFSSVNFGDDQPYPFPNM